jgi:hypothetical protein
MDFVPAAANPFDGRVHRLAHLEFEKKTLGFAHRRVVAFSTQTESCQKAA